MAKRKLTDNAYQSFVNADKISYVQGGAMGNNRADIGAIQEMLSWSLIDTNDVNKLAERFKQYIDYCYENDLHIMPFAVYNSLGVTQDEFNGWLQGKKSPAHKTFAEAVNRVCAAYLEMKMANGQIMPVTGIWWQKNFYGLQDKPDKPTENNNTIVGVRTPEQIAASLPQITDGQNGGHNNDDR